MNIEITRASIADAGRLIEIQKQCFYDDFMAYGKCPVYNESLQAMEKNIANAIVYKIMKDGEIIGDIIVRQNTHNRYYLRVICVLPVYQNLGIGQKAMMHIEKDLSDALEWELITSFKSYRNHHFYAKMGYVKIREYVQSDALTMFVFRKCMTNLN
ncbi:MAG: GNAT family N-acetyltransferase [Hyphomonadaceae bacterium]|nr:GNAT family N-acetyltransferase [Clostridia bacterium]